MGISKEERSVKKYIHDEIQKCFSVEEICEKYRELLYCGQKNIEAAVLDKLVDRGWGKAPIQISVASYSPTLIQTDDEQDEQLKQFLLSSLPHVIQQGEIVQTNPSPDDQLEQASIEQLPEA